MEKLVGNAVLEHMISNGFLCDSYLFSAIMFWWYMEEVVSPRSYWK